MDTLVDAVYREAGEAPSNPPGIGKLAPKFFFPDFHVHMVVEPRLAARLGALSRDGDRWTLIISTPFRGDKNLAAIGDVIARVIAHEALLRGPKTLWSDEQEQELADAIVLPSQALLCWSGKTISEIARDLVTTPALVERRWRVVGPASASVVRVPKPLAKASSRLDDDDELAPASGV